MNKLATNGQQTITDLARLADTGDLTERAQAGPMIRTKSNYSTPLNVPKSQPVKASVKGASRNKLAVISLDKKRGLGPTPSGRMKPRGVQALSQQLTDISNIPVGPTTPAGVWDQELNSQQSPGEFLRSITGPAMDTYFPQSEQKDLMTTRVSEPSALESLQFQSPQDIPRISHSSSPTPKPGIMGNEGRSLMARLWMNKIRSDAAASQARRDNPLRGIAARALLGRIF